MFLGTDAGEILVFDVFHKYFVWGIAFEEEGVEEGFVVDPDGFPGRGATFFSSHVNLLAGLLVFEEVKEDVGDGGEAGVGREGDKYAISFSVTTLHGFQRKGEGFWRCNERLAKYQCCGYVADLEVRSWGCLREGLGRTFGIGVGEERGGVTIVWSLQAVK
jgi:hypothetical protein